MNDEVNDLTITTYVQYPDLAFVGLPHGFGSFFFCLF